MTHEFFCITIRIYYFYLFHYLTVELIIKINILNIIPTNILSDRFVNVHMIFTLFAGGMLLFTFITDTCIIVWIIKNVKDKYMERHECLLWLFSMVLFSMVLFYIENISHLHMNQRHHNKKKQTNKTTPTPQKKLPPPSLIEINIALSKKAP